MDPALKDEITAVVMLKCHKSANRHESKISALGGIRTLGASLEQRLKCHTYLVRLRAAAGVCGAGKLVVCPQTPANARRRPQTHYN